MFVTWVTCGILMAFGVLNYLVLLQTIDIRVRFIRTRSVASLIENIITFHIQTITQADLPAITSPLYELNAIGNRFGVKLSKQQFLEAIAQSCRLFDNSAAGDIATRAGEFLRDIFVKTLQATFTDYERQESALARLLLPSLI